MKKITTRLLCASSILLFGLSSCVKDVDLSQAPEKPVKGDYFDFQTTLNCPIDIDLGLQDYTVSIEIYSENPFEENDGISTKKDIEPIYRGITDAKGILKGETTLPAYIKKAYIYSPYVGVPFIETEVTASRISAGIEDPKNRSGNTRATTYTYPSDMLVLGNWNESGYPSYLLSERFIFPENELYNITKATTSPYKEEMQSYFPQYFTPGVETGIPIIKETKVNLAMIGKYAPSVSNTILYYTYPTGQLPSSVNDIQKIIAFPVSAGISCGSTIQLHYWNKETNQFEDKFPAGVTIGWGVSSSAFIKGNIGHSSGNHNYYSVNALNTKNGDENNQHTIAIFDKANSSVTIGIEDRPLESQRPNYTDVIMYCHADVEGAIDGSNMAELEKPEDPGPSEEDNYTTYFGLLAFEDLWPDQGDYDLNDVVVYYQSRVYKNMQNRITSTIDEFTPYWDGAGYNNFNGFGYRLSVTPDKVTAVNIAYENYTFTASPLFQFDNKGLEERADNDNAIIIVADNMKQAVKQKGKFTVTTTFGTPQIESAAMLPPYNPFIIINALNERGKELHLPNYAPTKRADSSHFGKGNDLTDESQQMYYISKDNMPYAIHLPNIKDFDCSNEGIRIDEIYPNFTNWVKSNGNENTDWYLHKKE